MSPSSGVRRITILSLLIAVGGGLLWLTQGSASSERSLRLINPSEEDQVTIRLLHIERQPITGRLPITLGPQGRWDCRGLQMDWGELWLGYRHSGHPTNEQIFNVNLADLVGASHLGIIQITFLPTGGVEVEEASD